METYDNPILEANRRREQRSEQLDEQYRQVLRRLAAGQRDAGDAERLEECLDANPQLNPSADVELVRAIQRREREVAQAEASLAALPKLRDQQRELAALDRDIAEKVNALLEPKRALLAQIEERQAATEVLGSAKQRLASLRSNAGHLID